MQQDNVTPGDDWAEKIQAIATSQDREAFTDLFKHFAPKIKAYGLALNSAYTSPEMADELVQDVMAKIWQKSKYFNREKAQPSTWIFAIARNCRIDYLRKLKRINSPLTTDDLWPWHEEPDLASLIDLERGSNAIETIINTLPAEQVSILREVYIEGKTHAEVATQTGLPLGTVKSRLRLAMEKLRSNMVAT